MDDPSETELHALHEAVTMITCPHYRGIGTCATGCTFTHLCMQEPEDGWFEQARESLRMIQYEKRFG